MEGGGAIDRGPEGRRHADSGRSRSAPASQESLTVFVAFAAAYPDDVYSEHSWMI